MNDDQNTIGSEDYFRVEVSTNGGSWTTARYSPDTAAHRLHRRRCRVRVSAQFRIRFVAADNDPGDILECCRRPALRELRLHPVDTCLADTNNDGILSPPTSALGCRFQRHGPACDQNADEACTPADFSLGRQLQRRLPINRFATYRSRFIPMKQTCAVLARRRDHARGHRDSVRRTGRHALGRQHPRRLTQRPRRARPACGQPARSPADTTWTRKSSPR